MAEFHKTNRDDRNQAPANQPRASKQTRAGKEGTSWLKIIGIVFSSFFGLALLAGVILFFFLGDILGTGEQARSEARDARQMTDMQQVSLSLGLYEDENGSYPDSIIALSDVEGAASDVVQKFSGSDDFEYTTYNNGNAFCMATCMEDSVPSDHAQQCESRLTLSCSDGLIYAQGSEYGR